MLCQLLLIVNSERLGIGIPFGETTRPRPFDAPRYTVSMMSISCPRTQCHHKRTDRVAVRSPLVYCPSPSCYTSAPQHMVSTNETSSKSEYAHLVVVTRPQVDHDVLVSAQATISHYASTPLKNLIITCRST